jgi:hypothetical protein
LAQNPKSPRPITKKLWQAAVGLTATLFISQISKKLVLDYSALKKCVAIQKEKYGEKDQHAKFY